MIDEKDYVLETEFLLKEVKYASGMWNKKGFQNNNSLWFFTFYFRILF